MTANIEVLTHSSIRITGDKIIYIDPFHIENAIHDADLILITHDHFDHFSPEDIEKVKKDDTVLVVPEKMQKKAADAACRELRCVLPGAKEEVCGLPVEAVAAYNPLKPFHPKSAGWVGYIVTVSGVRIYIAGDTDITPENKAVSCDVAMVPIGGTYTMDAGKAAELVNTIRPGYAIPTHYGSVAGSKKDEEIFRSKVKEPTIVEIKMQRYS